MNKLVYVDRLEIDEENYGVFAEAERITATSYVNITDDDNAKGYIDEYGVVSLIEELIHEIDYLKERIEDMEKDIEDNYKPISKKEQYGISDDDFI